MDLPAVRGDEEQPQPEFRTLPLRPCPVYTRCGMTGICLEDIVLTTLIDTVGQGKVTDEALKNAHWVQRGWNIHNGYNDYDWKIRFPGGWKVTPNVEMRYGTQDLRHHQWFEKGCIRAMVTSNGWGEEGVFSEASSTRYSWIMCSNSRLFLSNSSGQNWEFSDEYLGHFEAYTTSQIDLNNATHKSTLRRELSVWCQQDMPEEVIDSVILEYIGPEEVLYLPSKSKTIEREK